MSSWGFLATSVCFGLASAVCAKTCDGFTRPAPTLVLLLSQAMSLGLFALAVRKLDLGLCYAVWCGLVAVLVTLAGVLLFQEQFTYQKALSISLIAVGVICLNLS
jgi:small multidrug resistance pump